MAKDSTTQQVAVQIDKELYKQLKLKCVAEGITVKSILNEIVQDGVIQKLKKW